MDQYYFSNELQAVQSAYLFFLENDAFQLEGQINAMNLILGDVNGIRARFADQQTEPYQRPVTVYQGLINLFTIYRDYLQASNGGLSEPFIDWSDKEYADYGNVKPSDRVQKIYDQLEGSFGFASEKYGTLWSIYFGPGPLGRPSIKNNMKLAPQTPGGGQPSGDGTNLTGVGNSGATNLCTPSDWKWQFRPEIKTLADEEYIGNVPCGKKIALEYTLWKCCPKNANQEYPVKLKGATDQFTVRIPAKILSSTEPCPDGSPGKVTYKRYFDVRDIVQKLYDSLDIIHNDTTNPPFLLLQYMLGNTNIYPKGVDLCLTNTYTTPKLYSQNFVEFGNGTIRHLTWGSSERDMQVAYPGYLSVIPGFKDVINVATQVIGNPSNIIVERFLQDAGFQPNDLLNSTQLTVPSIETIKSYNSLLGGTLLISAQEKGYAEVCATIINPPPPPEGSVNVDSCLSPYNSNNIFQWSLALEDTPVFQDIYDFRNDYDDATKLFRDLEFAFPTSLADNAAVVIRNRGRFIFEDNINIQKTSMNKVERKSISSNPCYTATAETFRLDIKRKRKRYIKIRCGAAETTGTNGSVGLNVLYFAQDAISNPDFAPPYITGEVIKEYLFRIDFTRKDALGGDSAEITRGKLATYLAVQKYGKNNVYKEDSGPNAGQLYTWEEGYYPLYSSDRTKDFVSEISDINTIEFTKNNLGCVPDEYCVDKGWTPDPTDLCGCVEVSVQECYDVYPALEYLDGNRIKRTIPERLILKTYPFNPDYPFLTKGQRVVSTRRASSAICNPSIAKLYHPLLYGGDILPGVSKNQVYGIFNGSSSLDCYYTSSTQTTASKQIYYDVLGCNTCDVTPFYAVAYGHYEGSGSIGYNYDYSDSSTKAIYSQFRLLGMEATQSRFTFLDSGSANTPKDVYVINYYRNGLSHKLDLGNFEINLAELNGTAYPNRYYTGSNVQVSSSNKVLSLIDNSGDGDDNRFCTEDPTDYYDIVSGSLINGVHATSTGSNVTTYGKIFPNIGVIVLDGSKLNSYLNFNSVSGSNIHGDNSWKIHTAISGAAVLNKPMIGRTVKQKTTNHYFIRIPVDEANYSTNPTYLTDDTTKIGHLKYDCFIDNPITYITTVGLYNDSNELLAIAKLNKPIQKSYENDILIKIRLNW
jgi:hypothetical protein